MAHSRPVTPPQNAEPAPKLDALGIHAAPPDIATPGSPLDVIDISGPSEAGQSRLIGAEPAEERSAPTLEEAPMEEVDITLGESAWREDKEEEAGEDAASIISKRGQMPLPDGELHASTSQLDAPQSGGGTSSRLSPEHPLRPDPIQQTQNRSPPPWEVVNPPETNNGHRKVPHPIVHEFGVKL